MSKLVSCHFGDRWITAPNQVDMAMVSQIECSRLQELPIIESKLKSISKSAHKHQLAHEEIAELIRYEKKNVMAISNVNPRAQNEQRRYLLVCI